MENFFKFIDKMDESILVLYDKNFFYTNHNLLISLGFVQNKRPVSLKQIIEPNWLTYIKSLSENDKSVVPLIKKNGDEKKFVVQIYPMQFEQSDYQCYLLKDMDEKNEEYETINWLLEKLPFAVIVFDAENKIFRKNTLFEKEVNKKIQKIDDLRKIYNFDSQLDFTQKAIYSFLSSTENETVLYLMQYLPKSSESFIIGIISKKHGSVKAQINDLILNNFNQAIQNLLKLNVKNEKFTHPNWQEIDNEIINLKQIAQQLELNNSVSRGNEKHQIDLYKTVKNELAILKSNVVFRRKVQLNLNIDSKNAYILGDYDKGIKTILSLVDRSVQEVCNRNLPNLTVESIGKGDKVILKIRGFDQADEIDMFKFSDQDDEELLSDYDSGLFTGMEQQENQLQDMGVQFNLNGDSERQINLTLVFPRN